MALGKASGLLEQAQYQGAVNILETFSKTKCDARIYLLLAAAHEANGDSGKAEEALALAHTAWPANTSIAASLAREYMNGGHVDKALQTLSDFHVTARTPLQEMQEGVIVYIAAHRLVPAQAMAEARAGSLFVMPSVAEAFGVAYIEAMAAGVPAIGCAGEDGPEEIAASGGGIELVAPRDPRGLAATIDALLRDPARRTALGVRARDTVGREFTWERCGRETVAAYGDVLRG